METKDINLVGDYLGTTEEFLSGKGTYSEEGKIYASITGKKIFDSKKHVAEIHGKSCEELSVGQTVFGEIFNLQGNIVQVIVKKIKGSKGKIDVKTGIHVSNIADEYIERPEEKFSIGDIIKAKVIKVTPRLVDLTTKGDLGIVKAFCRKCRHSMIKSGKGVLECENCGSKESRKIASDYGNVTEM